MDSFALLSRLIALVLLRPEFNVVDGKPEKANSIFDSRARKIYRIEGISGGFSSAGGAVADEQKLLVLASKQRPYTELIQEDRWAIDATGQIWCLNCHIEKGDNPAMTVKSERTYEISGLTDETARAMIAGMNILAVEMLIQLHAQELVMINIISAH